MYYSYFNAPDLFGSKFINDTVRDIVNQATKATKNTNKAKQHHRWFNVDGDIVVEIPGISKQGVKVKKAKTLDKVIIELQYGHKIEAVDETLKKLYGRDTLVIEIPIDLRSRFIDSIVVNNGLLFIYTEKNEDTEDEELIIQ